MVTLEKKERGDTVTNEEITAAFKDYTGQRIPGGEGDDHKIEEFDMEQMTKGVMVEFEHTDDVNVALEITIDHLSEFKKYYTYLEKMEAQMALDEKNAEGVEKTEEEQKDVQ
jgi:hypothetical protein